MNFVYDYLSFLAKSMTLVVAIALILMVIVSLKGDKNASKKKGRIYFDNVSDYFTELTEHFSEVVFDEDSEKPADKPASPKKHWWAFWQKKPAKVTADQKPILFVVDFDGDIAANAAQNLRQEISAILHSAGDKDEVLVRLKSPGGVVNGYGLAASQLARIRDKGLPLTIAVDEVAASGGYLMACVANKIIAAPFSILGSIGVVAQLPNFHKILEKYDIDYEQFTAGKYKRTVTMFGENSEEAKDKFREELEDIHMIFKQFVVNYRPQLDIEKIATGEHWLGVRAKELDLIDELKTSDAYIQEQLAHKKIISVAYVEKKSVGANLSRFLGKLSARIPL